MRSHDKHNKERLDEKNPCTQTPDCLPYYVTAIDLIAKKKIASEKKPISDTIL
jgi:hypothetical protein